MTVSYLDATALARAELNAALEPRDDLVVSTDGYEDAEGYLVPYGPAALILGGDDDAVDFSLSPMLVDKDTGRVWFGVSGDYELRQRLNAMTPVDITVRPPEVTVEPQPES